MTEQEIRASVRCGACHGKISQTINIVQLGRKATWPYPTCGNVITGDEGEACALLCDGCIETNAPILEAVEFVEPAGGVYHPIEELEKI